MGCIKSTRNSAQLYFRAVVSRSGCLKTTLKTTKSGSVEDHACQCDQHPQTGQGEAHEKERKRSTFSQLQESLHHSCKTHCRARKDVGQIGQNNFLMHAALCDRAAAAFPVGACLIG